MLTPIRYLRQETLSSTPLCYKCGNQMERIRRTMSDRMLSKCMLGFFQIKRYMCLGCLSEARTLRRKSAREAIDINHTFSPTHGGSAF